MLTPLEQRYRNTMQFMKMVIPPPASLLDIGKNNPLSERMRKEGYTVYNTPEVDLDYSPEAVKGFNVEAVTAFEILEHLVNPFTLLMNIEAPRLIATIPLNMWFAKTYNNPDDPFDRHFHEFEPWQFHMLLEKAGWEVIRSEKWISRHRSIGFRTILRFFIPRYYAVEAVRKKK